MTSGEDGEKDGESEGKRKREAPSDGKIKRARRRTKGDDVIF